MMARGVGLFISRPLGEHIMKVEDIAIRILVTKPNFILSDRKPLHTVRNVSDESAAELK